MTRWFEDVKNDPSNIVSSRVRLSRNWEEYKFPSRLEDNEARYMVGRMMQELRDIQGRTAAGMSSGLWKRWKNWTASP